MGAGAHSVAKCRGRGGYYRGSAAREVEGRGKTPASAVSSALRSGTLSRRARLKSRDCALLLKVPARALQSCDVEESNASAIEQLLGTSTALNG